jgi:hypothetical protein
MFADDKGGPAALAGDIEVQAALQQERRLEIHGPEQVNL